MSRIMLSRTFVPGCQCLKKRWRRGLSSRGYSGKSSHERTGEATDQRPEVSELLRGAANFNESTDKTWSTTPYPEGAPSLPEDEKIEKPKLDPSDASILLFPGQGVLKVGTISQYMKFPRVRELYENANAALGYDLEKLCLHGPQSQLDRTEFNQPATVVASLAALERLWEERPRAVEACKVAAGYSVGELTALVFSGAISIEDAIRLAAVRGAAMQTASDKCPQGMISTFCTASAKVSDICKDAQTWATDLGVENPICRIAVYLYTQGKVLAGNEEALRYIEKNGASLGLRRIQRLAVSGAFHTELMEPALKPFMKALATVQIEEPRIEVYSNAKARPYNSIREIKKFLPKQIVTPVKWEQILQKIYERPPETAFPRTFDLGSGGTMKIILKKVNAKAWDHCQVL